MKTEILENSLNYTCEIIKINNLQDIEGADKIQKTIVNCTDIIVSKEVNKNDVMLDFTSSTKLNYDYCKHNNLFTDNALNLDTTKKGYISPKQLRIQSIKLKGIVSNGILLPVRSLLCFTSELAKLENSIGLEFNKINDTLICEKYVVKAKEIKNNQIKRKKDFDLNNLIKKNQFHFHKETEHFVKNSNKFDLNTSISITRKVHGSSHISSYVLINKNLKWYEKFLLKLKLDINKYEYGFIWSSGKPKSKKPKGLISETNNWNNINQSFYSEDIWLKAHNLLKNKLEKGITIYAELTGKGIQGENYTYNKDFAIDVYRITFTNEDGIVLEFNWNQVKKYCELYDLNYVKEYFVGTVKDLVQDKNELLKLLQDKYLNKSYPDCKIDEGICIRIDETNEIFKLKSPNFILMESKQQEQEIINIEDEN